MGKEVFTDLLKVGKERRDLNQVKCIKNEEGKVLVPEYQGREKTYFPKLFNKGHKILLHYNRLNTRDDDQNYTFYRRTQKSKVKESLKRMDNSSWIDNT